MFRFEHESFLYLLLIVPILVLAYIISFKYRQRKLNQYGDKPLIQLLMPNRSTKMQHIKWSILMIVLSLFIIALANPQVGSKLEKGKRKGVDIMVCLDVSNSMLAQDYQPDRLGAAKMSLTRFIDQLKGDRIGLVIFAGKAFIQLPITSDYAAAKMFINYVNPSMINTQGTDISAALDLATAALIPQNEKNDGKISKLNQLNSKVIIMVSDGEDHFEEAVDITQKINKMGITVHTIGIGSTKGEPIPTTDRYGNITYKKDNEGNTVITRLNEQILQDIAYAGAGLYVHASNASIGFETIADEIDKMYKSDLNEVTFSKYESRYQVPLLLGILFLVIYLLLFDVKSTWTSFFKKLQTSFLIKNKTAMLLLLLLPLGTIQAQTIDEIAALRQGNRDYEQAEKIRKEGMELLNKGGEVNERLGKEKLKSGTTLSKSGSQLPQINANYPNIPKVYII